MSKTYKISLAAFLVFAVCVLGTRMFLQNNLRQPDSSAITANQVNRLNTYSTNAGADEPPVLQAQAQQMRKVQVTLTGAVFKKLPDDTKGLPHERWLMKLANGSTVLIAHDTKLAPYIPLQNGDTVTVHGEYIWNDKGGVIHWTHHDPGGRHDPGWVDYNGQRYQ